MIILQRDMSIKILPEVSTPDLKDHPEEYLNIISDQFYFSLKNKISSDKKN